MKIVVYTGSEPTAHCEAGLLYPGKNEIHDDALADRLLIAGRQTRDFLAPEDLAHGLEVESRPGDPQLDAAAGMGAPETWVEELAAAPAPENTDNEPAAPAPRRRR